MKRGNVLRIYENAAVFENLETGSCLLSTQLKDGGYRARDLQVCDRSQLSDMNGSSQVFPFESIFGIYDLLSGPFAALVTESECYVSFGSINIRKTKKIILIPMFKSGRPLSETRQNDENRYIQLLNYNFSEPSFFYSTTFDITLTQQQIALLSQRQLAEPVWMRADVRFFWNRGVIVDLIACEAFQWIVPFMSAYVESRPECEIHGDKFTLLFISRRSRYRQGCRFTKRGADDYGNVANFVETEQIVIFPDGKISSFVQIRGSIPIRWSSPVCLKYEPPIYIEENKKLSYESTEKHIQDLVEHYSDENGNIEIVFINLIDNKKDQARLGSIFQECVENLETKIPHQLRYIWFDYHHECRQKGKEKNLEKLVKQVDPYFKTQKYFCRSATGQVVSWQKGVFRTNCMDNLDRTNVVQSILARRSLFIQLERKVNDTGNSPYAIESKEEKFEKIFKTVWINNADALSKFYAGTSALKTDVVRKGKRTFKGVINDGLNSVKRYFINNLADGAKQDAIDLLLGNFRPDPLSPSPFISRPDQESLVDNLIKAFVLMMILFSFLLLLTSPLSSPSLQSAWTPSREHDLSRASGECLMNNESSGLPSTPLAENIHFKRHVSLLSNNLLISFLITVVVILYIMYRVIKQGSKIGECIAVHPQLLPELIHKM